MDSIYVRSKLNEKEFKKFLLYNHFFAERYYIPLRIGVSFAVGLGAAFFSSEKFSAFAIITVVCLLIFLLCPWGQIAFNYKHIYRRNRSGAFSQYQDFQFTENLFGMKSEHEEFYDYIDYADLLRVVETKSIYVMGYSRKQNAVISKAGISKEEQKRIHKILYSHLGERFIRIKGL